MNLLKLSSFLISVTLTSVSLQSSGQTKELVSRIDRFNTFTRLEFEKKYDSIVQLHQAIPNFDSLYLYSVERIAANAYFSVGDTANGFKTLERAIELQDYPSIGNMKNSLLAFHLDSNSSYKRIVSRFEELSNTYTGRLNLPVLKDCLEIFNTDVRIRTIWMTQTDSVVKNCADRIMYVSDSTNVELMKALIRKIDRYPGISDIGTSFTYIFNYIVTHFASVISEPWFVDYIIASTKKGQLPNWYGPRMLDKLEYDKGAPQLYGEFISYEFYKDGVYIYPPITDIEHVDQRRAKFLLPPLYREAEAKKCILPIGYDKKTQKRL